MSNNNPNITNTTNINNVTGQVHTGSGDINVSSFLTGSVSSKEEFLAALREFKIELETARNQGISENIADDALTEIEAAEREAEKPAPASDRVLKRLENTKNILTAGTDLADAAVNRLLPIVHSAIQIVGQIL